MEIGIRIGIGIRTGIETAHHQSVHVATAKTGEAAAGVHRSSADLSIEPNNKILLTLSKHDMQAKMNYLRQCGVWVGVEQGRGIFGSVKILGKLGGSKCVMIPCKGWQCEADML